MPITIGTNISSLQTQRQLSESSKELSRVLERLASGQRINHASDDAAGLSIASQLSASARVLGQAYRNVNDGISVAAIAEGALTSLRDISSRQLELAEQAANGTYSLAQRTAMNREANALVEEFNRIVESTSMNGISIFDPNLAGIVIQAGTGTANAISIGFTDQLRRGIGDGTFAAGTILSPGGQPYQSIAADFNGDGRQDLVTANFGSGNATVFLGNGDGTFRAPTTLTTGGNAERVDVADLNGDGRLDIVTANLTSNEFTSFLNLGNGTFSTAVTITTSGMTATLSLGDINGDGLADLVGTVGTGLVNSYLGNGNGTFRAAASMTISGDAFSSVLTDLNGDGRLDFAVSMLSSAEIQYFLGTGTGGFVSGGSLQLGGMGYGLATGDFDGDGRTDLVGTNYNGGAALVFMGNGNGSFRAARTLSTGGISVGVTVGDINGDGRDDIVTANYTGGAATIFIGNGNGTFRSALTVTSGGVPFTVTVGDFNSDDRSDLVLNQNNGSGQMQIFNGLGGYSSGIQYLNINTQQGAREALVTVRKNLDRVITQLGSIGAVTSRFSASMGALEAMRENALAAAGRIQDADIASESAELARRSILQQSAAAVLAQANQQPALAVRLLS